MRRLQSSSFPCPLLIVLLSPIASCSLAPFLSIPDPIPGRAFKLQDEIVGSGFYGAFYFQTFNDPTHGRVNYVDKDYATSHNLTYASDSKFVMRADTTKVVKSNGEWKPRGRDSIRIASKKQYDDSVIVLDLTHMPTGCGTWPAFWTVTTSGKWPSGGEIDIIEGVNNRSYNLASLHTSPDCNMRNSYRVMSGRVESNECDGSKNQNKGCGVKFNKSASFGRSFNELGGGWFAMRRAKGEGISVWFWSRYDLEVPDEVQYGTKRVHVETWGSPEAVFTIENCDIESHFGLHEIVFDLTFCGDWAGSEYANSGCPGNCVDFVDNNPRAFLEAYWEINSLRTYVIYHFLADPKFDFLTQIGVMITLAHPTTRQSIVGTDSTLSFDIHTMDAPKQGVLRLKTNKEKENLTPSSALPRLSAKKDPNQSALTPVRKVSGSQPTLGAAALRTQVDALRAENAKLRKEHQRELSKLQDKTSHFETKVQELVREKLLRESAQADTEREQRMASQREAALRTALERSEAALKQVNERTGKLSQTERKLDDLDRIHSDEKRKLTAEISSLQSQLEVARTTMNEHSTRLRERDASRRFEVRARDLEFRLQEQELRIRELEDELATAEAQAEVYEGRVQVYDKRVRAYKDRVRIAEQQAREAEAEIEALQVSRTWQNEGTAKELEYTKMLLERLTVAYGELAAQMREKDRTVRSLEWALSDKGKRVETLERSVKVVEGDLMELAKEFGTGWSVSNSERWKGFGDSIDGGDDSRAELNELLVAAMDGQREMRAMEVEELELLAQQPRDSLSSSQSLPSSTGSSAELEIAQLRAQCAALQAEQDSLEQDLVDAAMDAEEHARQASAYKQLQTDYASLEAELLRVCTQHTLTALPQPVDPNTRAAHAQAQADLTRLETEHKRLQGEFAEYKRSTEEATRAVAEHEARAVLLNGLQAREHALREQMDELRACVAELEKKLVEEKNNVKKAEEKLTEAKVVEEGLRYDINEMMEALDRVDRYEEAYETLVSEVVGLGLADDELDRLQKLSEATLGVSTAKQKLRYVEQVKAELDRVAQKLTQTEWERDQARAQGADLRRELSVFQTVTGLNGWTNPRSSSTPPVRPTMTPPPRVASTPLRQVAVGSAPNGGSNLRPELRALGLGLPSSRPNSVASSTSSERRISRALSLALEAENMTD